MAYCKCPEAKCDNCKLPVCRDSSARNIVDIVQPIRTIIDGTDPQVVKQAFHSLLRAYRTLMRTDRSYREDIPFSKLFSILVEESHSDVDPLISFVILLKEGMSDKKNKQTMESCIKELTKHVLECPVSSPVDESFERQGTHEGLSIKVVSNFLGTFSSFSNYSQHDGYPQDIPIEEPMDFM